MKKRIIFLTLLILTLPLFAKNKATLTKSAERFYWEISGTDKNGNPSKVYILGTFHIGDERLFPLPEQILTDFDNADIICGELSTEGWANVTQATQNKMMSQLITDPKKQVRVKLSKEDNQLLIDNIGEELYQSLQFFSPAALKSVVDSTLSAIAIPTFTTSYDLFFIQRATEQQRQMEGLDSVETQIDLLFYGNYNFQLKMLETSIEQLKDPTEYTKSVTSLYEAYITFDEKIMTEVYEEQLASEIKEFSGMKKYYKDVLPNRNKKWVPQIVEYLDNGGTTFIFAGVGHFLGKDSVFELMKKQGYLEK